MEAHMGKTVKKRRISMKPQLPVSSVWGERRRKGH